MNLPPTRAECAARFDELVETILRERYRAIMNGDIAARLYLGPAMCELLIREFNHQINEGLPTFHSPKLIQGLLTETVEGLTFMGLRIHSSEIEEVRVEAEPRLTMEQLVGDDGLTPAYRARVISPM